MALFYSHYVPTAKPPSKIYLSDIVDRVFAIWRPFVDKNGSGSTRELLVAPQGTADSPMATYSYYGSELWKLLRELLKCGQGDTGYSSWLPQSM